ncbi:MAG: hypothetical protein RI965_2180 [Bacteroidota bacterium]|jgi:hypothetical protein
MLLIFPAIYIILFLIALRGILRKREDALFLFVIIALPIYNTALTITYGNQLKEWIPILQSFKEVILLLAFISLIWNYKKQFVLQSIDKWLIAFFAFTLIYVFLPLGKYGITQKIVAFKSLSFFVMIYFTGRLFDIKKFQFEKIFSWIGLLSVASVLLLLFEVITYTHFQTYTDYAFFNQEFYGIEPSGRYGLTWSFELNEGLKRFASFFSNPLELAGATLVTTAMLMSAYTDQNNRISIDKFGWLVVLSTFISILFALSRSSLLGYVLLIYVYSLITNRREITYFFYTLIGISMLYVVYLLNDRQAYDYLISTIQLSDTSSIGHVLEWIEGVQSMFENPLGRGLGESGRVSAALQENVGGENQFIIVGVQTGVISLILYFIIYIKIIGMSWKGFKLYDGAVRKLALAIFLMKISFLVPMLTSNFDSYSYITYFSWLITGLMVSMMSEYQVS